MKIETQKVFSRNQLDRLQKRLIKIKAMKEEPRLCIYTTGSYGRLEASRFSDMDLFFLTKQPKPISKIRKTIIDAQIVETCRAMGLPEFSGDGEYLEVHNVNNILEKLGGREDDYQNCFTARMLLLLESKPLHNEAIYDEIIKQTIGTYYKDFPDHYRDFQPVFLVNDIIRFWRTLCLNYEYSRKKNQARKSKTALRRAKIKSAIKNLKLKFSRKLTCYSMLLSLLWARKVSKKEIRRLVGLTPMERLAELKNNGEIVQSIDECVGLYEWFLTITQVNPDNLYLWMSKESQKKEAVERANRFGQLIYEMMLKTPYRKRLRYYLV